MRKGPHPGDRAGPKTQQKGSNILSQSKERLQLLGKFLIKNGNFSNIINVDTNFSRKFDKGFTKIMNNALVLSSGWADPLDTREATQI